MTLEDCLGFIGDSREDEKNCHYAIADEQDEYMGTISLKEIDRKNARAEYAISCRTKAMGKGYAREATRELFRIAREELGLKQIYLNVYDYNIRAQKMYQKAGFARIEKPEFITEETDSRLLWYQKKLEK
jgi:diamine N-acetyltransferase